MNLFCLIFAYLLLGAWFEVFAYEHYSGKLPTWVWFEMLPFWLSLLLNALRVRWRRP